MGSLESPPAILEAVSSGMLLGCLEKPPAFLEAVPSAWTVTRGVVDALRASTVTSSVPPPLPDIPLLSH